MKYQKTHKKSIHDSFIEFHGKNPEVYKMFEKIALEAIRKGKSKISAKAIINVIRWDYFMKTKSDDGFKINDIYHSRYSRLFVEIHPEHKDIFVFRKLRS